MVEKIDNDLYRIGIPLPGNPLKELNSYVLLGGERNLVIDTGFNMPECKEAMDKGMKEIGLSRESCDLFITHVHSDHCGLVGYLSRPDTQVYCSNYTSYAFAHGSYGNEVLYGYFNAMVAQSGLPMMDLASHPGAQYAPEAADNVVIVQDGDIIRVGNWTLQCIMTSGHAPEHVCLYDKERKVLFSGDHILAGITPNNALWDSPWEVQEDLLGEYLANLDKMEKLAIAVIYPAHRASITNVHGRIQELKEHHARRLNGILMILGEGKMNGAEIAGKMHWDLRGKLWSDFSLTHKLFATGEALSHLTHFVHLGVLKKELCNGIVYYSKSN